MQQMSDMDEEMRHHIELDAERLMREEGLSPEEARRRAHVRFCGLVKYQEAGRDVRERRWIDALWLDTRFGVRMLLKYRGLTLVGVFAMAIAVAVGATLFEVLGQALDSTLPFPGGERVVSVQFFGAESGAEKEQSLHDAIAIRDEAKSLELFGVVHTIERNLISANTAPEPVEVAEISASAFALTGTPAMTGRFLLPADESPTSPPVMVIGHAAWQTRFGSDPNVVGRVVNLGGVLRTIVGMMPDGYQFPFDHQFWVPFRDDPLQYPYGMGPPISTFGRLVPGATVQSAQAEVSAILQGSARTLPEGGERVRPNLVEYTREFSDIANPGMVWLFRAGQILVGALTFVVAINLAVLVYARTVTRLGELSVRSALGARRRRILVQLFIEAFALSISGTIAGLLLAGYGLSVIEFMTRLNGSMPFWMHFELSPAAIAYAFGLAIMAALIMGVLPGLRSTGASVSANLHELNGRGGTRLGATWTSLIVAQVAIAVAVLPAAVFITSRVARMEMVGTGFDAGSVVIARAGASLDASKDEVERLKVRRQELIERIKAEPGVAGVTFTSSIPGFGFSDEVRFEDGVKVSATAGHVPDVGITNALWPSVIRGSLDLFDVFGVQMVAGRNFAPSDLGADNVVINRSFATMYLPEVNPIGLRFHFPDDRNPTAAKRWFEIVGVVADFPAFPPNLTRDGEPTIYRPVAMGEINNALLSVRFSGPAPDTFINRLREIGAEVDPALQLRDAMLLGDFYADGRAAWRSMAYAISLITLAVLLLSAAGIYALMSFTVAQRTREIGIRTALGAHPRRVLMGVFGRAAWQVGTGVLVGTVLSSAAFMAIGLGVENAMPLLGAVAAIMAVVGLLAAFGPARRGARIQVTEALRAD